VEKNSKKWLLVGLIGLAGLICIGGLVALVVGGTLAFGIFQRTVQSELTPVVVTVPAPAATLAEPTAALPPAATSTPVAALPTPNARYAGLDFQLDPALGSGISGETVAAVPPSGDSPPWEVAPQHRLVNLNGYPLTGQFQKAQILVYPVAEYEAISDEVAQLIYELRILLDDRPANPEFIPLLPFWNAAQIFRSNVAYMEFQNGRGVRFLTQYGQDIGPIANQRIFYSFQGLTDDGAYYVSVILPINHSALPTADETTQEVYEQLAERYPEYLAEMTQMLNTQTNGFTPSLDTLDALVQSIEIH